MPAVGVLVLPGGDEPGMLETLLCRTFEDTPLGDCIEGFFECVHTVGRTLPKRPEKARASAWVSIQPEPQVSVGVAAKEGYWDLQHQALADVRVFLERLYRPET